MRHCYLPLLTALLLSSCAVPNGNDSAAPTVVYGGNELITYVGRTDRSVVAAPRQWAAGAYFTFAFEGDGCSVDIVDENLGGYSYNYLEIAVDTLPTLRVRTRGIPNTLNIGKAQIVTEDTTVNVISVLDSLPAGRHTVLIARDTEPAMGYTQVSMVAAPNLQKWAPETNLRMEFIGNSITSGMDCYLDEIPTGGQWFDRTRAYYAYGPVTARMLGAQWALSSISGIGLMHSCCEHTNVMPELYDKIDLVHNRLPYHFDYKPDILVSALGQNDGVQDSATFVNAYVTFLKTIVDRNPSVRLILISSPMADATLREYFRTVLPAVAAETERYRNEAHPEMTDAPEFLWHIYEKSYNDGGTTHPSMAQQTEVAQELVQFIRDNKEALKLKQLN
ncbi:MAG: hypothetical protein MRZ71_06540 [Bacteroidales bacterium]|nr:hypothetical protein [Bacteroidales bacterium]